MFIKPPVENRETAWPTPRYLYLLRLRYKTVLIRAIQDVALDIAWPQTGFTLPGDYDAATGDFKGLTDPIEDGPAVVADDTYLVASATRAFEPAAAQASSALDEIGTTAPSPSTPTSHAASMPQSPPGDDSVVERARYEGRYEADAAALETITDKLREFIAEVVRHIVSAENISPVLEVSEETSDGFSEAVGRTVRENSRVLGTNKSDFEDVKW